MKHTAEFCLMRDAVIEALKADRASRDVYGIADKIKRSQFLKEGVTRRVFSTVTAATHDFCGPGELIVVESGGNSAIIIRLRLEGRHTVDVPAIPGAHYRLPYASAQVIIPADAFSTFGNVRLSSYPDKDMFVIQSADWIPIEAFGAATNPGNVPVSIQFPLNRDMKLDGIHIIYIADATAITRNIDIRQNSSAATPQFGSALSADITASETMFFSAVRGAGPVTRTVGVRIMDTVPLQVPTYRAAAVLANNIIVTVVNGQAGDAWGLQFSGFQKGN